MLDFEVQRCTRRCAKSDRELRPGEAFYSLLVTEEAEVVRYDYSESVWEGPPEENIGWWKSRMPTPNAQKVTWAPNDVMMHYFKELENRPEKKQVRYVLTLLMIRRRILKLIDSADNDSGNEILTVYCSRDESEYTVPVTPPDDVEVQVIQEELAALLFANAA
ncbi:MAG: hypothetical protein MK165_09330 [Pirellulaceae bacterium]|nr:hypothetical protein [Pirellulaceae bacterium]